MLPEKIKIGWKTYEIQNKESVLVDNSACYGSIDYDGLVISLRQANTKKQNEATLLHEILHGIENMNNLDLGEHTITVLADAFYTVLCDNELNFN
ncbi:MAG: hypothetical protein RSC99_09105 [Clostridiales bacterium]